MCAGRSPDLARLVSLFVASEENQNRYPFYFGNLARIMASAPMLREGNDAFVEDIYTYYSWSLIELRDEGVVLASCLDDMVETTAYSLVTLQSSWTQVSSPYHNESLPRVSLAKALCTLLYAYVEAPYRETYQAICHDGGVSL